MWKKKTGFQNIFLNNTFLLHHAWNFVHHAVIFLIGGNREKNQTLYS